jgi:hypothetical protein
MPGYLAVRQRKAYLAVNLAGEKVGNPDPERPFFHLAGAGVVRMTVRQNHLTRSADLGAAATAVEAFEMAAHFGTEALGVG